MCLRANDSNDDRPYCVASSAKKSGPTHMRCSVTVVQICESRCHSYEVTQASDSQNGRQVQQVKLSLPI